MFSSSLQSSWKLKGKDIGRSNDIQGRRAVDLVSNEVWKGTLHWSRPSNRLFLACRQAGKGVRPSCEGVLRGWRGPRKSCGVWGRAEQCLPGFSGLTSSFPGTNCLIIRRVTELPVEMSTTPTKKNVICVLFGSRYDEGPHYILPGQEATNPCKCLQFPPTKAWSKRARRGLLFSHCF